MLFAAVIREKFGERGEQALHSDSLHVGILTGKKKFSRFTQYSGGIHNLMMMMCVKMTRERQREESRTIFVSLWNEIRFFFFSD